MSGKGDPLSPGRRSGALGAAALGRGGDDGCPSLERGVVVAWNSATHTAIVRTDSGRPLRDVPRLSNGPGDYAHLAVGTSVVVSWELGYPFILGCLDFAGAPQAAPAVSLTGTEGFGDDDPIQPVSGSNTYKPPGAPTDLSGGDWARVGPLGNHVAILDGGLSLLGAPSAQVRSMAGAGVLQLVARSLQALSDFGQWRTENDQGRTSFVLRAGSSQSVETGLDEQHWTIRLDLGAAGDLFDLRVTEPEGRTLFRLHAGADGRVQIYGDGGVDVSAGAGGTAEMRHDVGGARAVAIAGDDSAVVAGSRSDVVSGDHASAVDGDRTATIGGADTAFSTGDRAVGVGGREVHVVTGAPSGAAVGLETRVVHGGWIVDVGNPSDGATLSARDAFALRTHAGDVSISSGRAASLRATAHLDLDGSRISIGTSATHPLPKFDAYLRAHGQFLNTLIGVLAGGTVGLDSLLGLPAALPSLQAFAQQVSSGAPFQSTKAFNE